MRTFEYKIKDENGIHARPAGMLAKTAKNFKSEITLEKDGKTVSCTKLIALMGLGVRCGDVIKITVSGADEQEAERELKEFFEKNL